MNIITDFIYMMRKIMYEVAHNRKISKMGTLPKLIKKYNKTKRMAPPRGIEPRSTV